ncbi:SixA phosphatase family protein [Marinobacterium sediminicola]|uniref:Phosphohistidine phosphatase n=1 Tax=Marinobacterium sediminicola TaxID=518898 RepID=A0ABY1S185_9GAMM|nr:histidine phosphatase family protein [Marinobacterium sediminicola]ULG69753.1 histidine phosphatase family protein [Marinobacterium sediminicola]SMR75437.1 phosphohistidine phosphatase [Marinobacterium sediminicola]
MKRLTLIRHAKSSWDDPFLADFDRPLNHRGQYDLPLMCARVQAHGPRPDRLIHSSALRTRLTATPLIEAFELDNASVMSTERIYEASEDALLELIRQQPDHIEHLMLVGHNPGLLMLAHWLCEEAPAKLPTSAVIQLELATAHWDTLEPDSARLLWFDFPKLHAQSYK